jgi:hypothetical protein
VKSNFSRRDFLSAGLALPAAGLASTMGFAKPTCPSLPASLLVSTPKLTYSTLGKTGLKVMRVGLGAGASDAVVIQRALDIGINYFDTARAYANGNHERMVGIGLKNKRKNVILGSRSEAPTKERLLRDLDLSLRELRTDFLDICGLHSKDKISDVPDELFEALEIAKKQGKIRFAALSTHNPKDVIPFLVRKGAMDVVLVSYNFTMNTSIDASINQASQAGMGVVTMKAMAGGFRATVPEDTFMKPGDPRIPKLKTEGAARAMLRWVLKNPQVNTTIVGTGDMDQIEENVKAVAEPYSQVDAKLLAMRLEHIGPLYCRMCGACEGTCAKGLPVADMLRYLTYADGYGEFSRGREHFLALPAEVTSVRCQDCVSCTVTCPFGVQVSTRLARAQEWFA